MRACIVIGLEVRALGAFVLFMRRLLTLIIPLRIISLHQRTLNESRI